MIKYTLISSKTDNEILLALVSNTAFNSFELINHGLHAYLPDDDKQIEIDFFLNNLLKTFPFQFKKEVLAYQNWNAIWESNFDPVLVADYCTIRANFHDTLPDFKYEIIINPKMAFGTGHHETTYMMILLMRDIDFTNMDVFDFGAGTGVLSILASFEGANQIDAIDIENESYINTIENATINKVNNITSILGTLENIGDHKKYDIILANINRKVLLDDAKGLNNHCNSGSTLLISGILRVDIDLVRKTYEQSGFKFDKMLSRGEWVAMKFTAK